MRIEMPEQREQYDREARQGRGELSKDVEELNAWCGPLARSPSWRAGMRCDRRGTRAVTWGLLLAWAVHDAEELATMPEWVQRARPRLQRRLPWVPAGVWSRLTVTRAHSTVAIVLMGCLVAAAAADGARTGGRSPFFQTVLRLSLIHI